jgi:hypothetical protein
MLGGSPCEAELSRMLTGIKVMNPDLEKKIVSILIELKKPFVICK